MSFAHAQMENQVIDPEMKVRASLHEVWDINSVTHDIMWLLSEFIRELRSFCLNLEWLRHNSESFCPNSESFRPNLKLFRPDQNKTSTVETLSHLTDDIVIEYYAHYLVSVNS